jgi:hypothetical protein
MGQVDRCLPEDIPAVADLHNKLFFGDTTPSSDGLRRYYQTLFFDSPWYDDELPSLVFRTNGKLTGFLGVVPRRMTLGQKTLRLITLHRLMVDPSVDSPLAAFQLVRAVLSAPQDLMIADGANDKGRKILERSGASICPIYSLKWLRPLRPTAFVLKMLSKRRPAFRAVAAAATPLASMADAIANRVTGSPFGLRHPETSGVTLDVETLLTGLAEFSACYALRPSYDHASLTWLLDRLKQNRERGSFRTVGVANQDQLLGLALYYLDASGVAEVMLLASRETARDAVLRHLMYDASRAGAVGLMGRLEPKFLQAFANQDCLMKSGDWAFVHARDPEIVRIVNQGEAFISALEGELWMRSPMDRL